MNLELLTIFAGEPLDIRQSLIVGGILLLPIIASALLILGLVKKNNGLKKAAGLVLVLWLVCFLVL